MGLRQLLMVDAIGEKGVKHTNASGPGEETWLANN